MDDAVKNTGGGDIDIDEAFMSRCENALVELSRSLKAVNFYPRGHPTLNATLDKTRASFVETLKSQEKLAFSVRRNGFTLRSVPLAPNNANLPPFAKELYHRQIKKVLFLPEITNSEIENFLRIVAMEPDLFRGKGKAEEYLQDNGVEHILVNEMKFGQGRSVPRKEDDRRIVEVDLDERLKQLIESIRSEKDPRKFLASAREASVTALRFIGEENYEPAFLILKAFCDVMAAKPPRPPLISEGARSAFNELTISPMVDFMLRQLTLLHGPRQEEILEVAKVLEDRLVNAILDKMATNEALYSHRALIHVLLRMPELAREAIEARLKDPNWFVVRKMAFLLGETGREESVSALIEVSGHSDPRVAKEVLKSLSKIKTVESTRRLVGLLSSKASREIKAHVIRLLGAAKEVGAVPTLVKHLKRRSAFLEDIEIYTEIVRALGQIGSQQATPVLEELLFKRNLLAKSRSLVLGIEATEALGNIGGRAALKTLRKGAENKNPDIKAACQKTLQARDKSKKENQRENGKEHAPDDKPHGEDN